MNIFSLNDYSPRLNFSFRKRFKNSILICDSRTQTRNFWGPWRRLRSFSNWSFKSKLHEYQLLKRNWRTENGENQSAWSVRFCVVSQQNRMRNKKATRKAVGQVQHCFKMQTAHRKRAAERRQQERNVRRSEWDGKRSSHTLCFLDNVFMSSENNG